MPPPRITVSGNTASFPSKGVHPHLLWRCSGWMVVTSLGYRAKSARSPGENPGAGIPRMEQGFMDVFAIREPRVISPERTFGMRRGIIVSTPGMPAGALEKSTDFSSLVWGAWSEARTLIPSQAEKSLSRSAALRRGGFTFPRGSSPRKSS